MASSRSRASRVSSLPRAFAAMRNAHSASSHSASDSLMRGLPWRSEMPRRLHCTFSVEGVTP